MIRTEGKTSSYIKPYYKKESASNRKLFNQKARNAAKQKLRVGDWDAIIPAKKTQGRLTW
jgi:hypothetical protein